MSVSSSVTDTSETRDPAGSLSPSQQQQLQQQHPGASGPSSSSSSSYTQGQGNRSVHHNADGGHAVRARARQRSKSGCLTCRLRKKRCDETKPVCAMCTRLGLECLGFAAQRPDWMRRQDTLTNVVARMKKSVTDHNAAKMNAYWTSRANSLRDEHDMSFQEMDAEYDAETESHEQNASMSPQQGPSGLPPVPLSTPVAMPVEGGGFTLPESTQALIGDLSDLWAYSMPQAMVDNSPSHAGVGPPSATSATSSGPASVADGSVQSLTPGATSPMVDPAFLSLLGILPHGYDMQTQQNTSGAAGTGPAAPPAAEPPYYPMLYQPTAMSGTTFPTTPTTMRFFRHYLEVIMPFQWIFERKALTDVVTPLAFTNPLVFESLIALGALHMGAKRSRGLLPPNTHTQMPNTTSARIAPISDNGDPDIAMAESSLRLSIQGLKQVPFNEFGTHEMIVSAMSVSSYHLFCGGNRRGWREAVDLCRKSLAAVLQGSRYWSSDDPESKLAIGALVQRMGHLLSPLVWTDILTSVTEGVTSQFLSLYRILLLDDQSQGEMGHLLRETVMGCDSTTRLAIAETIAFEEWKATAARVGSLSMRELVERANSIERLLGQRQWRERHLFDSHNPATLQRRAVSDVFFHSTRVLLATVLNGAFPGVVEVAAAVADVVDAFHQLDLVALQGAERALVFPTVIAGCHADAPELQMFFKDRFERLGEEAAAFGNTRNAMRLMEEVWRRRAALAAGSNSGEEVHWRQVMLELDEEGLLLI